MDHAAAVYNRIDLQAPLPRLLPLTNPSETLMTRRSQPPSPDTGVPAACDGCGRLSQQPAAMFGLLLCEGCHERLRLGRLTVEELLRAKQGRRAE
jgi:hypothetical protein